MEKLKAAQSKGVLTTAQAMEAYLLARDMVQRGQLSVAEELLVLSFSRTPNAVVGLEMIKVLAHQNKLEQAQHVASYLCVAFPKNISLLIALVELQYALGDKEALKKTLQRAYRDYPDNENITLLYAAFYPEKQKEILEKYIATQESSVLIKVALAQIYLTEKKETKAHKLLQEAYAEDPENPQVNLVFGDFYTQKKDLKKAESYYYTVFQNNRNTPGALKYIQNLLLQNEAEKALAALLKLEAASDSKHPFPVQLSLQIARLQIYQGEYIPAQERLAGLPPQEEVFYLQGVNEHLLGNFAAAHTYLEKIPSESVFYKDALKENIVVLFNAGHDEQAKTLFFQTYLKQKDLSSKGMLFAAQVYIFLDDLHQSLSFLNKSQDPLGEILKIEIAKKNKQPIVPALLKLAKEFPHSSATLNYVGYSLVEQKVYPKQALEYLQKAVAQEPQNAAYLDSLCWLYIQQNNLPKADSLCKQALQYEPQEAVILFHNGFLNKLLGKEEEAQMYFKSSQKIIHGMFIFQKKTDFEIQQTQEQLKRFLP